MELLTPAAAEIILASLDHTICREGCADDTVDLIPLFFGGTSNLRFREAHRRMLNQPWARATPISGSCCADRIVPFGRKDSIADKE